MTQSEQILRAMPSNQLLGSVEAIELRKSTAESGGKASRKEKGRWCIGVFSASSPPPFP
jgi:hypothetical protein